MYEGCNFITNANAHTPYGAGLFVVRMKPIDQRFPVKDNQNNSLEVVLKMQMARSLRIKDCTAFFLSFPTEQGFGSVARIRVRALQIRPLWSMDAV